MIDHDTTRLPLGTVEWQAFLNAIEHAADEDESEWVEWKSTLDLTSKAHIAMIAKAIVAFANRAPADAISRMEGRGLLLVGIAPGEVRGVTPRDPADLDRAIRRLLAPNGPRFGLHWVSYRDKTVLIVEVAGPAPGDPIHHIARASDTVPEGAIYVRRPGRSEPATSADIQTLSARLVASAKPGLDLDLRVDVGDGLPRYEWRSDWIEEWLRVERALLMRPLEASQRPKPIWELPQLDLGSTPESRTPEAYEAEVDDYIARCRTALDGSEIAAARFALSPAVFRVVNNTDRNFADLEVKVHIEGDVEAYESLDSAPSLRPSSERRPRTWGPIPLYPHAGQFTQSLGYQSGSFTGPPTPRPDITNGGSTSLTLVPVDLRPYATQVVEEDLVLLTREPAGTVLRGTWTATATNVTGRAEDTIEIPVADDALDLSPLLTHARLRDRSD